MMIWTLRELVEEVLVRLRMKNYVLSTPKVRKYLPPALYYAKI
jgi:hypothetical protein